MDFRNFFSSSTLSTSIIESLTCFFNVDNFIILASIDSYVINFIAHTYFVCPIRCTRPTACYSIAGFHQGSIKNTLFAHYKFKPTEPVFRVMIRTCTFSDFLNYVKVSCRVSELSVPFTLKYGIFYCLSV